MTNSAFISVRPQLKLNGDQREDLQSALTGLVVNLPLHGCAHGEITLTNWGIPEGQRDADFVLSDIQLGDQVDIEMGEENPTSIFSGEITAMEEQYGDGAPTLALLVQDKLHHLARHRQNRSYEDYSPDDIIADIASQAGLQSDVQLSSITDNWHQINESDLAFILRLAGRFDIAVRLQDDTLWAKPEQPDNNPINIDAQDSALKVRLMVDLNHQPTTSKVQGYNASTAEAVDYEAEQLTPAATATSAADTLSQLGWDGVEVIPHPFARSQAEAEAYAHGHFQHQAKTFVKGDIICQGEPQLKSGKEIELTGVSPRLRGTYQIVHCSHRFDSQNGYETHLKVNKADWSPDA